ncbi:class I SAM-dependent methyltransferase [Candidatus Parcubacteria bacterium]|nr:MAG: class I SAM-dependent methyltransferase [Candidatus Parcubacteria bacterium]
MDNNSSSFHNLNADKGLKIWQKPIYLLVNVINNLLPNLNGDPRLKPISFRPKVSKEDWFSIEKTASMARKWSHLFWMSLPWDKFSKKIGSLNILDIGCGPGGYGPRFLKWGGKNISSYLGVDPLPKRQDRWNLLMKQDPRLKYKVGTAGDIESLLEGQINMVVSQSALEHIDYDILFFRRIAESLKKNPKPFLQIHLIPAASTLALYLFHGIRQYTPSTISKITKLFPDADVKLYGLGGWSSWFLHWKVLTWPLLIKRKENLTNRADYPGRSWSAFSEDVKKSSGPALFYALVIASGINKSIFNQK